MCVYVASFWNARKPCRVESSSSSSSFSTSVTSCGNEADSLFASVAHSTAVARWLPPMSGRRRHTGSCRGNPRDFWITQITRGLRKPTCAIEVWARCNSNFCFLLSHYPRINVAKNDFALHLFPSWCSIFFKFVYSVIITTSGVFPRQLFGYDHVKSIRIVSSAV